jgi:IMP dehydrogenase
MQFLNAHNVVYEPDRFLSFDDVLLVPKKSHLQSRNDPSISLRTKLTQHTHINCPIISANMDTVTGPEMVFAMAKFGGFGILHRFFPTENDYIAAISEVANKFGVVAFSIGAKKEDILFVENVLKTVKSNQYIVCLDVAHAHLTKIITQIKSLRNVFGTNIQIIAGNICTAHAAQDLIIAGVDAIKVGVGSGSFCSTRIVTGCGMPQLTAIMHCRRAINAMQSNIALIADGGIRNSGDIVKALAAGANTVMIGKLFAGTTESAGPVYEYCPSSGKYIICDGLLSENKLYKKYRGQSSRDFMNDIGKQGVAAEGVSSFVPYKGSVENILRELIGGIRSSMTYNGVDSLEALSEYATFIEITANGLIESMPHGINNFSQV